MAKKKEESVGALTLARTLDTIESLIFLKDDPEARRFLVAWKKCGPFVYFDVLVPKDTHPQEAYDTAWAATGQVDIETLARNTGIPYQRATVLFERMMAAHLIFPDGSISQNADTVIKAEMRGFLQGVKEKIGG